ncbi:hypothetical protein C1646_771267 [Rhizophagus diaphanus]|nr:hypothetical protein C1646_771267 [Rhizophagus diaphanus] [Rhizophagus sp. MUCL 43196]
MFLEDLLEADGISLMKWKHMCKELGLSTKGRIPVWFKEIESKILDDASGMNERTGKHTLVTWNEEIGEFPIFAEDKKRSIAKITKEWEFILYTIKTD